MEPMPTHPTIPKNLRGTMRHRSSNLIPALLLLPAERRRDALLLGEWCHLVDDITDDPALPAQEKRAILERWLNSLLPGKEDLLPADFRDLIARRNLERQLLVEVVQGMLMDLGKHDQGEVRFATFPDLELYCRRVASAVGLLSARIFGGEGPMVERYAEQLGIALQLTNILRDVAEDGAMDRIYLPLEDLGRFGVAEEALLRGDISPAMTHLLHHQAERADSWFAKAETSWSELDRHQRHLLRPARLMSSLYRELLLAMHRDRYDVFAKRYSVPPLRKLMLLLRVLTE